MTFNQVAELEGLTVDEFRNRLVQRADCLVRRSEMMSKPQFYEPIFGPKILTYYNINFSALLFRATNILEAYLIYYDYLNEFLVTDSLPVDQYAQLAQQFKRVHPEGQLEELKLPEIIHVLTQGRIYFFESYPCDYKELYSLTSLQQISADRAWQQQAGTKACR